MAGKRKDLKVANCGKANIAEINGDKGCLLEFII
jgi:hypothetical protein